MSEHSSSTSPDPLTLPSSPLRSTSPLKQRSHNTPSKELRQAWRKATKPIQNMSSPSKSFIMDTGPSAAGDSPWRIKVTVEAEPSEGSGSPAKRARVVREGVKRVPLKSASSSPTKRDTTSATRKRVGDGEEEGGGVEGGRKRRGTPVRRRVTRAKEAQENERVDDGSMIAAGPEIETNTPSKRRSTSPRKGAPARNVRAKQPTERSRRLTQAREERDAVLKDALDFAERADSASIAPAVELNDADLDNDHDFDAVYDAPGDITISLDEDFTMVSVETLQSMKQNTSQLLENSGVEMEEVRDKSGVSVSYLPSSPPVRYDVQERKRSDGVERDEEAGYPDISVQASAAKEKSTRDQGGKSSRLGEGESGSGDAMSWKYTTQALRQRYQDASRPQSTGQSGNESQHHISSANGNTAAQPIEIESDASPGAGEDRDSDSEPPAASLQAKDTNQDDDIWAEEASRSLEEEESESYNHQQDPPLAAAPTRSPQLADLFSDEAQKPLRGKIPRTWRRSSGVHFSYVDSPEYGALRKTSGTSTEGDGGDGGVLTPPSTDDEKVDEDDSQQKQGAGEQQEDDAGFDEEPDAAGTFVERPVRHEHREILSRGCESSSSATTPDAEEESGDTGLFWQTNLPNIYDKSQQQQQPERPRRWAPRPRVERQKKAMDLSELLGLDKSSPVKQQPTHIDSQKQATGEKGPSARVSKNRFTSREQGAVMMRAVQQSQEKVISSPLRRSLIKSSKIGGNSLEGTRSSLEFEIDAASYCRTRAGREETAEEHLAGESTMESFESKASDQRQLLQEMQVAPSKSLSPRRQDKEDSKAIDRVQFSDVVQTDEADYTTYTEEDSYDDDDDEETEESNEVSTTNQLRSYEEHLNLDSPQKIQVKFGDSTTTTTTTNAFSVLAPTKVYPPLFGSNQVQQHQPSNTHTQPSRQSNHSTTGAVPNKDHQPQQPGLFSRVSTSLWSTLTYQTAPPPPDPEYDPLLRRDIRSRYGVLSDQHPWTMSHMRTLHRLLNSCTSNMPDSIVPTSGPLPTDLEKLIGKKVCKLGANWKFIFTTQHAYVVEAFMQTLVPSHIIAAMKAGEMEFLGDEGALEHRGWFGKSHGDDLVFGWDPNFKEPKGAIERAWVVRAVGNCVAANLESERRKVVERERLEGIERSRREWEARNGFVYDDDDE